MPAAALPPVAADALPVMLELVLELELELDPPQACRINAAMPAAPPVSAVRRVSCRIRLYGLSSSGRSSHSSRSIASWMRSSLAMCCSSLSPDLPSLTERFQNEGWMSNHI